MAVNAQVEKKVEEVGMNAAGIHSCARPRQARGTTARPANRRMCGGRR
jgi:hypothetical protein